MKGSKINILRVLDRADSVDVDEGRIAYFRYHENLRAIAARFSQPLPKVVAVFAALSPNSDYVGNLRSCVSVLQGHADGVGRDFVRVSSYNHCRDRAFDYLNGTDFLGTVKGPKIRAFYQNLLNPIDPEPVTIDGHAVNVWRGRRQTLKSVVHSPFRYNDVADDYRAAAAKVGLLPNQVQAITWFAWKRIHSIIYPGRQLELFRDVSGDHWQTLRDVASIEPFPYFDRPSPSTLRK